MGRAGIFSGSGRAGLLKVGPGWARALKIRAGPGSGWKNVYVYFREEINLFLRKNVIFSKKIVDFFFLF